MRHTLVSHLPHTLPQGPNLRPRDVPAWELSLLPWCMGIAPTSEAAGPGPATARLIRCSSVRAQLPSLSADSSQSDGFGWCFLSFGFLFLFFF